MADGSRRFDGYLPSINADKLKSMMRLWGQSTQLRKDECIAAIRQGLADPSRVKAALATLTPTEANALALVKAAGGVMNARQLAIALMMTGKAAKSNPRYRGSEITYLLQPIMRRGLLLIETQRDPFYFGGYDRDITVFADERLLAQAGNPTIEPFKIKPTPLPGATLARRPQTVALDLIGILQAVENLGGIQLTKDGQPRANEVRKLAKNMGWKEDILRVDGLPFPNPSHAWLSILQRARLLAQQGDVLLPLEPTSAFAIRPYADQVRPTLAGVLQARDWDERGHSISGYRLYSYTLTQMRQALLMGLAALPPATAAFFAVDDLDRGIYERVGEDLTLDYRSGPPHDYGKTASQYQEELAAWRAKIRQQWLQLERPWLDSALTTWAYTLGLVELAMEKSTPVALRLTDLGHALLHPGAAEPEAPVAVGGQTVWVVQPNFEIVVYLDQTSPQQLAFLERHAERIQAQQHIAQYRLTRESVYQALESGSSLESLVTTLEGTAGRPLPQNVAIDLHEWAALREQIVLHRRARLVEYADQAGRDAAAARLNAAPVSDRFLLVTADQANQFSQVKRVDYAQPLPRSLTAHEDGLLTPIVPPQDLLLGPQLERWAERLESGRWRLSQASVAAAMAGGLALAELLKLLNDRLARRLPRWLEVAVRAWAGERSEVALAEVLLLQCPQAAVFEAIVSSPRLSRYLRGVLAPDLVAVDAAQEAAFREQLQWAGLEVSDELLSKAANKSK